MSYENVDILTRELHRGYRRGKTVVIRGNAAVKGTTCCEITAVTNGDGDSCYRDTAVTSTVQCMQ